MNPMLYKLKCHQTQCPIYRGQVLPLCKEKLQLNNNDSLNNAFFKVDAISKLQTHTREGNKNTYRLAMMPVEWDEAQMTWGPAKEGTVSPHPFDISLSSEQLYDNFGVMDGNTSSRVAAQGEFTQYVEDLFKKAKRHQEWKEKYQNLDFDMIFKGVARRNVNMEVFNQEEREDLIRDALIQTLTPENLNKFDANKGGLSSFLGRVFQFRLLDEIRRVQKETLLKDQPPVESDYTEESRMDYLEEKTKRSRNPNVMQYSELLTDFHNYIENITNKEHGRKLGQIFDNILVGDTQKDIAEKFGVSQGLISRFVREIKGFLLDYARDSENPLLTSVIEQNMKEKVALIKEDIRNLRQIFEDYKEETTGVTAVEGDNKETNLEKEVLAERVPVGDTITIKRKPLPNLEEITKTVVQDPNKSSAQATKDVESYLQEIISSDELIEQDGKLISLRVIRK